MTGDRAERKSTGTRWLVLGLVAGAVLVAGPPSDWIVSPWVSAGVLTLAVLMYFRAGRTPDGGTDPDRDAAGR